MSETLTNPAEIQNEVSEEIFIPKFCPRCHYNLKGMSTHPAANDGERSPENEASNCPECGFDFRQNLKAYMIPWMRDDISPPLKFLRTLLFFIFRPKRTRYNLSLDLDSQKAKRFNLYGQIILLLAFYSVFAYVTFTDKLKYVGGDEQHIDLVIGTNIGALLGLVLMLPLLIDSPLWFCRKSEKLNEIRCLGQFGSIPFLLMLLTWPIPFLLHLCYENDWLDFKYLKDVASLSLAIPFYGVWFIFWLLALRLVKASGRGMMATCAIMTALPVIWAAILFIAFVAVPYLFYAMAIMVLTF